MTYTSPTAAMAHQLAARAACDARPPAPCPEDVFAYLMDMGTGKSKVVLDEFGHMATNGGPRDLLVLAPKGSLRNWYADKGDNPRDWSELRKHVDPEFLERLIHHTWVGGGAGWEKQMRRLLDAAKDKKRPRAMFVNIEALSNSKSDEALRLCLEFAGQRGAHVVVDECFVAGTLVSTPWGKQPIEDFYVGDIVNSTFGTSRVKRILKKQTNVLVHIKLVNGARITATPNHPFLTNVGWVCAGNLEEWHVLQDAESLRVLCKEKKDGTLQKILQLLVCSEVESVTGGQGTDLYARAKCQDRSDSATQRQEAGQVDLEQGNSVQAQHQAKVERGPQEEWSHVQDAWWQWKSTHGATANAFGQIRLAVDTGACHSIGWQAAELSNMLQGGLGSGRQETGNRVRWTSAQHNENENQGRKERQEVKGIRVESVTLEEFINPVDVFDLELAGTPHFFVEDVLVHNSTTIKGNSERTDAAIQIGRLARSRRILSGLWTPKSPLDLFYQCTFLDERILGYNNYYTFRSRYAKLLRQQTFIGNDKRGQPRYRKFMQVVGFQNQEELSDRVAKYSYRVLKRDCLDLEPKVYAPRDVEMTPQQKKMFEEFKLFGHSAVPGRDDRFVTVDMVIKKITRELQICCGYVMDDEERVLHEVPERKTAALLEVLEEHAGKAIVWCPWHPPLQRVVRTLTERYGARSVSQFHGKNVRTRNDEERRFLSDPECLYMVATQGAGMRGNTWTVANLMVYYANNYDLEQRDQSEDRNYRIGQDESVTVVDLIVQGTRENKVVQNLRDKIDLATAINREGQREWVI